MGERLTVSLGLTKNLGNFNSLRLDAHFETDLKQGESVEEGYERAWAVVEKQIEEQMASYEEED